MKTFAQRAADLEIRSSAPHQMHREFVALAAAADEALERNYDKYLINVHGKITSIAEAEPGFVNISVQLEKDLVAAPVILTLPHGYHLLSKFVPGKRVEMYLNLE